MATVDNTRRGLTPNELALGAHRIGQLPAGPRGPVTIRVELMAQHSLETYYHVKVDYPGQVGADIRYSGHKDDLVAAGCISADVLTGAGYNRCNWTEVSQRSLLWVSSKAGPGKRGWIEVEYVTCDRSFATSLPGVLDLYPEGLPRTGPADRDGLTAWLSRRPRLRLVVDNTRVQP